jgi:hypothetical protein
MIRSNETHFSVCRNGRFNLPDAIYASLEHAATRNFVYLREDGDSLMIATTRLEGGYRRALHTWYRALMFRSATKVAFVNLNDSVQVMAVA